MKKRISLSLSPLAALRLDQAAADHQRSRSSIAQEALMLGLAVVDRTHAARVVHEPSEEE